MNKNPVQSYYKFSHCFLKDDKFHLKPVHDLKEISYICTLKINLHLQR